MKKITKDEIDGYQHEELNKIQHRIDNHIDEDGNNILDDYPYYVELKVPTLQYNCKHIDWLKENIDHSDYIRPWPHLIYFKHEEDAMGFKLQWL